MIRRVGVLTLLALLACLGTARAQATTAVLDSLMDTHGIPKPLLDQFAKAYDESWVVFGSGFHQNFYFLPRTIKTTPAGTKTVWGVNLQGGDSDDWLSSRAAIVEQRRESYGDAARYDEYLLTRIQWEIDCPGQRARIVELADYDEDGRVIWSTIVGGPLEPPVPDSNGEGLLQAFCHPQSRITFRDVVSTPMGTPVSAR